MASGISFQLGRLLVITGIVLVALGLGMMWGSRVSFFGLGRLPGDITYKSKHVSFYFPIVTCIILSVVVTLILWLISLSKRP